MQLADRQWTLETRFRNLMALSMMLLAKEVNKPDPWGKTSWQLGQLFGLTNFWPGTVRTEN